MTAPAALLPWDSDFFGVRIARAGTTALSPTETARLLAWSAAQNVGLLYLLAELDPPTIREAERADFGLMDMRLELAAPAAALALASGESELTCRAIREGDLDRLRPIAQEAHRDSRFFADSRIPPARAEELFVRWLERDAALGDRGWVGVADAGSGAAGYLTAMIDAEACGRIGLLAVGAGARGRGLGRAMLGAAGRWLIERGVAEVRVVTQGRNIAAQRLYQSAGFRTVSAHLWYHKWFAP